MSHSTLDDWGRRCSSSLSKSSVNSKPLSSHKRQATSCCETQVPESLCETPAGRSPENAMWNRPGNPSKAGLSACRRKPRNDSKLLLQSWCYHGPKTQTADAYVTRRGHASISDSQGRPGRGMPQRVPGALTAVPSEPLGQGQVADSASA